MIRWLKRLLGGKDMSRGAVVPPPVPVPERSEQTVVVSSKSSREANPASPNEVVEVESDEVAAEVVNPSVAVAEKVKERSESKEALWSYNLKALMDILQEDKLRERQAKSGLKPTAASSGKNRALSLEGPVDDLPPKPVVKMEALVKEIDRFNQIPALGSIASSVQMAAREGYVDLEEIANLIKRDPGLYTKVLRLANSAFIAPSSPITDVEHAISMLGVQRVRFMTRAIHTLGDLEAEF